jgi:hypothetical protein
MSGVRGSSSCAAFAPVTPALALADGAAEATGAGALDATGGATAADDAGGAGVDDETVG